MSNIIIGNIISFIGAIFLSTSCVLKNRKLIFYFQAINCFILAVASVFFYAYAGIAALITSGIRNIVVAHDKYTTKLMYIFLALTVILGIVTNNRGIIGLIPVIATVQYTVCLKIFKTLLLTRISIWINTALWIVYSFIIMDYSTCFMDSISLITVTFSLITLLIQLKKENHLTFNIGFNGL